MKKLYSVEVRYYVMAEDLSEAHSLAQIHDGKVDINAWEATSVNNNWWDAIPYNSDDDRTCGQIIKGMRKT